MERYRTIHHRWSGDCSSVEEEHLPGTQEALGRSPQSSASLEAKLRSKQKAMRLNKNQNGENKGKYRNLETTKCGVARESAGLDHNCGYAEVSLGLQEH